ncbi:MAG TPA: aminopeptidase P family protein [Solirubrobacteraceae bacterium]|nr:aminopeptidase P family protein [Solirubrobacteraceae bacterium]
MSSRADRVAARLADAGVDCLLVASAVNLRYLTGFTGSNGLCVLGPGVRRFATDFRYVERARREVAGFDHERAPRDFLAVLAGGWPDRPVRLGFEDQHVSVRTHARLRELLPERVELVAAGGLVERERAVKDAGELEAIAAAAALADDALREVLGGGVAGRTERQVAAAIDAALRRRGAEPSFEPIVAAGPNGSAPHAAPADVPIPRDTLVTIDWGARLDGYCSDCTRTFATGEVPDEMRAIYDLVERAQAAALDAVRPGPSGREVDAVARHMIGAAGHAEHFGHGLGHGVGLEVHEAPRLATTADDALEPGNVVTVEPGVYVPGLGGVRIEDLVAVAPGGRRVLSGLGKALTTVT